MRILYIFPHPDDESFGPAGAIYRQVKQGHEVHLLTLTRGGATQVRHKLNLSVAEMGALRYREMLAVQKTLGISTMKVLDYEDSGLKEMDPRILEEEISRHIVLTRPNIVITYPVHGGSGFHDHLVTYAIVKRAFLELKSRGVPYLRRLAFFTMPDSGGPSILLDGWPRLKLSEPDLIDCIVHLEGEDVQAMKDALSCYESYKEMVQKIGVIEKIGDKVHFEIAFEKHDPPLDDLTEQIPELMPRTFSASFF